MWQGDGRCDDINNIEICKFDGGDCCGNNVDKSFCKKCECKEGKELSTIHILIFHFKTILYSDIIAQENEYLNALCNVALFTNGECDPENNKIECGFDGGDCVSVQGDQL